MGTVDSIATLTMYLMSIKLSETGLFDRKHQVVTFRAPYISIENLTIWLICDYIENKYMNLVLEPDQNSHKMIDISNLCALCHRHMGWSMGLGGRKVSADI